MSTTKLSDLIEKAIMSDGSIWPSLAVLEQLDVELETLSKKARETLRPKLELARQTMLIDVHQIAAVLAAAIERQVAVEQIVSTRRPVTEALDYTLPPL